MIALLSTFRALCGRGISLSVQGNKLSIKGEKAFLSSVDLAPITEYREVLINNLPHGLVITARTLADGLDACVERAAILEYDGSLERAKAETVAMALLRDYLDL